MNWRITVPIGVAVIAIAGGIGYWQWTRTPAYSIKKLVSAIKDHDRDDVEKYLDVGSLATGLIDQFFAQLPQEHSSDHQWTAADQTIAHGFLEMVKPKLVSIAKEKFLSYVETGKFEEGPNESGPAAQFISTMRAATSSRGEFSGITSIKKEGKIALVTVKFRGGDKQEISAEITMRDKGGYWQIVGVNKLLTLLQRNSPPNRLFADGATVEKPTFEKWVASRKQESDLRQFDFRKVYRKKEEQEFTRTIAKRWTEQCKRDSDYHCRLISYLFDAEEQPKQAIEALHRSCSSGNDIRSCAGLLFHKNTPQKLNSEALKIIHDGCTHNDPVACELAGLYASEAKKIDQALSFYNKSCQAGHQEGCSMLVFAQYQKGQKEDSMKLASMLCDDEFFPSCFQLGHMKSQVNETSNAVAAYKKGCGGGDGKSCMALGGAEYEDGNITNAIRAWAHSCNALEGGGCFFIGLTLLERNEDKELAKEMFRLGCTLGHIDSCEKIKMRKPAWL